MKKSTLAYFCLALAPLLWSTNFVNCSLLGRNCGAGYPYGFSSLACFSDFCFVVRPSFRVGINRQNFVLLVVMGLCGAFLFNFLLYLGLIDTTAINSAIINALLPTLTMALAVIFLKERSNLMLVGIIISFAGVGLIILQGSFALGKIKLHQGDLLVFLATLSWAVYTVIGKLVLARLKPLHIRPL